MTVSAPDALAAGTVLFNQPFHDNTVDGSAGSVSLPATPTKTNVVCLSAAGNATANPLASCASPTDPQGSGKLRLTANAAGLEGGIFASTSVPTSQGLDVTFNSYQYGGGGADGMAFVLAAVDPANPVTPSVIGQSGGALGYSAQSSNQTGLSHGYLGVGLDAFGNFSNKFEGTGCTDPANIAQRMPGQVVVRGPGNGTVGYCPLQSSAATATSPPLVLRATTRAASVVPVEVVYNPSSSSVTTPSGLVVPASWVSANGFPKQLAFGWVGSTGSVTDFHEIDNAIVTTLNPVPQLTVSQTSYAAATLAAGSSVTYQVAASSSGAAENAPVTVTETLPAGVLPVGASGPGWVCAAPSGQQIIGGARLLHRHQRHQP
jgi:Bacterial lectin